MLFAPVCIALAGIAAPSWPNALVATNAVDVPRVAAAVLPWLGAIVAVPAVAAVAMEARLHGHLGAPKVI
jgi:hypothetical protein